MSLDGVLRLSWLSSISSLIGGYSEYSAPIGQVSCVGVSQRSWVFCQWEWDHNITAKLPGHWAEWGSTLTMSVAHYVRAPWKPQETRVHLKRLNLPRQCLLRVSVLELSTDDVASVCWVTGWEWAGQHYNRQQHTWSVLTQYWVSVTNITSCVMESFQWLSWASFDII